MDEVTTIKQVWALAKEVGPGATLILGLNVWWLIRALVSARKESREDKDYIREANQQNIKTLMELTHTIQTQDNRGETRHNELVTCINNTCQLIMSKIEKDQTK